MNTPTVPQPSILDHPDFYATMGQVATWVREHMPAVTSRLECAMQIVFAGGVTAQPEGGYQVRSQTDTETAYHVNGVCECKDAQYGAPDGWCKHKTAVGVLRRVEQILTPGAPVYTPLPLEGCQVSMDADQTPCEAINPTCPGHTAPTPEPVSDTDMLTPYIVQIHGKAFVQFAGLLKLAHARGLQRLEARFISVTPDMALAEATATFTDGRVFSEAADASPKNTNSKVAAHFPRCALTRAKARCLRDALCVDMVAFEELGE